MDFEKYKAILAERWSLGPNGRCQLWDGATREERHVTYGVINVKINDKWRVMHAHRLAMYCRENKIIESTLDVSHLCHNSTCINPLHLSVEPHHVNNNRKACTEKGWCVSHEPYPDCLLDLKQ